MDVLSPAVEIYLLNRLVWTREAGEGDRRSLP